MFGFECTVSALTVSSSYAARPCSLSHAIMTMVVNAVWRRVWGLPDADAL